jgi:hypothetical protein
LQRRLGIGSDFDGGFGRQEVPLELGRAADFRRLARIVPPEAQQGLLGGSWLGFLGRVLSIVPLLLYFRECVSTRGMTIPRCVRCRTLLVSRRIFG